MTSVLLGEGQRRQITETALNANQHRVDVPSTQIFLADELDVALVAAEVLRRGGTQLDAANARNAARDRKTALTSQTARAAEESLDILGIQEALDDPWLSTVLFDTALFEDENEETED